MILSPILQKKKFLSFDVRRTYAHQKRSHSPAASIDLISSNGTFPSYHFNILFIFLQYLLLCSSICYYYSIILSIYSFMQYLRKALLILPLVIYRSSILVLSKLLGRCLVFKPRCIRVEGHCHNGLGAFWECNEWLAPGRRKRVLQSKLFTFDHSLLPFTFGPFTFGTKCGGHCQVAAKLQADHGN